MADHLVCLYLDGGEPRRIFKRTAVSTGNDKIKHDVVYAVTGLVMLHDMMSRHITSNRVTVMWVRFLALVQCRGADGMLTDCSLKGLNIHMLTSLRAFIHSG